MIVAGANDAADLRYASGFMPVDPVVFVDAGEDGRFLVVPPLEVVRARHEAPNCRVLMPSELGMPYRKSRLFIEHAVALARRLRLKRVEVAPSFPVAVAKALEKSGVKIRVAKGSLYPERAVKTEREIRQIAQVQRAAVEAMKAAFAVIKAASVDAKGRLIWERRVLTSEGLRAVIEHVLLDRGCAARDPIVACGPHAADPHHRGEGPLRAGETIVLDIFPQHKKSGYWGDLTRTVVKGRARPEQRRMFRAVKEAHRWAIDRLRAGAHTDAIHKGVRKRLEEAGFKTDIESFPPKGFFHGTGHGVGLEIHEAPTLSLAEGILKAGHVVTVEPGLYYPDLGGVRIEDTVVITNSGAKLLASCPCPFEIP